MGVSNWNLISILNYRYNIHPIVLSLKNLFVQSSLIGFPLFRRFIFFFLGRENVSSFGLLGLGSLGPSKVVIIKVHFDTTNIDTGLGGQQIVLIDASHGATVQ